MVLPDAALGPDFGPVQGALTFTAVLTALVALARAAVQVPAACAPVTPAATTEPEITTTDAAAAAIFLLIVITLLPYLVDFTSANYSALVLFD
jgi:hypothetical protein